MSDSIVSAVQHFGLLAVFVLMLAESCAVPFPSEIIMPFAGLLAAQGHIGLVPAIVVGALGNLAGSLVAYVLAARFGRPLLLGPGRWVGFSETHLESAQRWFDRYGLGAVLVGRVVPVVRTYISFPAGLAWLPLAAFSLLTFLGALVWSTALAVAGYEVGANYDAVVAGPIGKAALVVAFLVVVALIAWFIRGRAGANATSSDSKPPAC